MLQWIHHHIHPRIWQSDNGLEFKGALLILLRRYGIKVINSRLRHPQSQGLVEQANGYAKKKLYAAKRLSGTSRWAAACPIIAASINRTYHELIGCTPFYCLYGRDPWPSTLVAPGHRATAEPPLEVTDTSEAEEEEDLDGNEEVLGPPLDENGDGRQAAEQEREDDEYSNEESNGSQSSVAAEYEDKENEDQSEDEENNSQSEEEENEGQSEDKENEGQLEDEENKG